VIGLSSNPLNPDLVYLVVQQGDQPTSYRTVISLADPDYRSRKPEGAHATVPSLSARLAFDRAGGP